MIKYILCGKLSQDEQVRGRTKRARLGALGPGKQRPAERLVGAHELLDLGGRDWLAEEIALHFIAADGEKKLALSDRLHAFGDYLLSETVGQGEDGANYCCLFLNRADKRAVDLQRVDGKFLQIC